MINRSTYDSGYVVSHKDSGLYIKHLQLIAGTDLKIMRKEYLDKNIISLNFSKNLFYLHLSIFLVIMLIINAINSFSLAALIFSFAAFLLYVLVYFNRSKSFYITNNKLVIHYILYRKKTFINLHEIEKLTVHKKIAEKDWHTLKVKKKDGTYRKYGFLFVKETELDLFYNYLKSEFTVVEI